MKRILSILTLGICYTLSSCKPKELGIVPGANGAILESVVNIGPEYEEQIYFSLALDSVTGSHQKYEWDLAFMRDQGEVFPLMNGAKIMYAFNTTATDITDVIDTTGFSLGKIIDRNAWNTDRIAMDFTTTLSPVYFLELGIKGVTPLGYYFVQFERNNGMMKVKMKKNNTSTVKELQVTIPDHKQSVLFNLDNNQLLDIQPSKVDWDLLFTQYTTDIGMVYLVSGVISQKGKIQIYKDSLSDFESLKLEAVASDRFDAEVDNIGYSWKSYDFDTNSYQLKSDVYIIKNVATETYYKLQFTDFYDHNGIKGNVKFRYQRL